MPFQVLHCGQPLYLTLNLATRTACTALIQWRDGRAGNQSRLMGLSYNRFGRFPGYGSRPSLSAGDSAA
jgi:hypothetical protein